MPRMRLLLNIVGYSSYLGLGWGGILGILYYLIVFQFSISIFTLYFAFFGAILGVLISGVNGIILSFVVYKSHAKSVFLIASVLTTALGSFIVFYIIFSLYAVSQQPERPIYLTLLASLFATVASAYLSQSIAAFYLRNYVENKPIDD